MIWEGGKESRLLTEIVISDKRQGTSIFRSNKPEGRTLTTKKKYW